MPPQDKPAPISLNLDTIEREGKPEPFVLVLGGKRYELVDPQESDYRDLLGAYRAYNAGDPETAIRLVVPEDKRDEFFANPLPNWKLAALFDSYNKHFGLPAPGEASASPTS